VVEIMPSYRHGGDQGMMAFLAKNIVYPAELPNGLVVVTFGIDTTGAVCDPKVARSLTAGADQEALRVVRLLEFVPAMQAGKNVAVSYTLPIRFSNEKGKKVKGH
jgi:TonB family protein